MIMMMMMMIMMMMMLNKQVYQIEVMQDCRSSCVTNRWHHDAFVVFINLEFLFESTSFRHRGVDVCNLEIVDTTYADIVILSRNGGCKI